MKEEEEQTKEDLDNAQKELDEKNALGDDSKENQDKVHELEEVVKTRQAELQKLIGEKMATMIKEKTRLHNVKGQMSVIEEQLRKIHPMVKSANALAVALKK